MSSFTVEAILQATGGDKFQQAFKGAQDSMSGFKDASAKLKSVGTKMTTGLTLPILGIGAAALNVSMEFESSMSNVAAVSGATGDDLQMLEDKAREMGSATNYSASEAADGLGILAMSGMDAVEMTEALEPVLKLAGASGLELDEAAGIVTNTLAQYGLEVEEASMVTDVLAKGSSIANTDVSQLGEALKVAGSGAALMGYDIESTTAILATLADQGLVGSQAGTAMNAMFRDMKKAAEDGQIAINGSSVAITDSEGEYREFTDIVDDLNGATKDLTTSQKDDALAMVMGDTARQAYSRLTGENIEVTKEYEDSLRGAEGAASDMYDVMNDNLAGSIETLKSALSEVGISLGETLVPMIKTAVEFLEKMTNKFNALSDGQKEMIVKVGLVVAALGPLLTIIGLIGPGIAIVTGALSAITLPIAAVIAAIVALVAGGVAVYKNWDVIKEKAIEIWGGLKDFFTETIPEIYNTIIDWFKSIPGKLVEIWDSVVESVTTWGANMWEKAKETGSNFVSAIIDPIKNMVTSMVEWFDKTITNIKTWGSDLLTNGKEAAQELVTGVIDKAKELPGKMMQVGKDLITGLWNGIKDTGGWVKDKVGGFMDGVLQGAKDTFGIKSPSKEFMSIGKYLDEGLVKGILGGASGVHRAMGGMIDGVLAQGDQGVMMDIGSSIARSNGQVKSAVSHEINNNSSKSPSNIILNLGDRNYKAFVEDITNSQSQSISFEESYSM